MTDEIPVRPRGLAAQIPTGVVIDEMHVTTPEQMAALSQPLARTPRDEWLEERRTGYGATDVPVLVDGDNKAWNEMHARKLGLIPEREATETMELGRILEQPIAKMVAARLGVQLVRVGTEDRPRILRHPELPYVIATLDRRRKRGGQPVEIKKWGWRTDDFGPEGSDQVPERMFWQVQQQLAVTGKDAADLAVLFAGSRLELFRVGRDDGSIDEILALQTENWAYVARGEIPPWPGPAPERPTIRHDEIEADEMIVNSIQVLDEMETLRAEYEAGIAALKDSLRERLIGVGGTRGELPDGRRFSISHRPNRDGIRTDWKLVAAGYRQRLLDAGIPEAEIDPIETALSIPRPGDRPLRVTIKED